MTGNSNPGIKIEYCPKCNWLTRSAWMAQEILGTFVEEISEVSLAPSVTPGHFQIHLGDTLLWCRKRDEGFPDIKTLKQRIRDKIAPDRDLGHIDK
jgi:selenoprotein W-related protein